MKSGYLIINKPKGPTSHDIIDRLRKIIGIRKIGHAGTLDPFAEGVLIVGIGRRATRNLKKFTGLDKKYEAVLKLGFVSDTYDVDGIKTKVSVDNKFLSREYIEPKIKDVIESFIGVNTQIPPIYSAKKIKGRKAYELARAGVKPRLKPQKIEIYNLKAKVLDDFKLKMFVHCSTGTYIRSLAHDIGNKLKVGAYLESLKRIEVGNFSIDEAINIEDLNLNNWEDLLINFKVVMASGTFEVLHKGHVFYLKQAKELGKKLVVVVSRDKRAEEVKGRRLRNLEDKRLKQVSKLQFVYNAILGDVKDPYLSIKKIKPDIIALGYDQKKFVPDLPHKIKEFGLNTKIARIPAYKPHKYKSSLILGLGI